MRNQRKLIHEKDWNVLIILDACRFDNFSTNLYRTKISGKLYNVNSKAINTEVWYKKVWNEKNDDVILISANPHSLLSKQQKNFFRTIEVWENDNWIRPETALDVLIDMQNEYPDKKFMVHLIPPHLPYIGEEGKKFLEELNVVGNGINVYRTVENYGRENGWRRIIECYNESLVKTLNIIADYIPRINGEIVISADHGEIIGGEYGVYRHNMASPEIFSIPWLIVEK